MIKIYVQFKRNEKFERKIRIACDFHSTKYAFTQRKVINIQLFKRKSIVKNGKI